MAVNAKNITDDEFFFGHKACAGCGGSLAVRAALKVLGPNAVCALPAGCMSAVGFNFPQLSFANNAMITPFAATASVLTGIEAGLRAQGKKPDDCTVVGFAGDGGTADIGIQALSGAIDRNDDVLYICYDNEAYMNTGIQKSSLTPFGAKTTTTPAGSNMRGCLTQKKNMFEIVAAHGIPYAATASIGYLIVCQRLHPQGGACRHDPWDEVHPCDGPVPDGVGLRRGRDGGHLEGHRRLRPVVPRRVRGRGVQAQPQPARVRQRRSLPAPSRPLQGSYRRGHRPGGSRPRREVGGHAERLGVARPNIGTSKMKGVVCSGALLFYILSDTKQII